MSALKSYYYYYIFKPLTLTSWNNLLLSLHTSGSAVVSVGDALPVLGEVYDVTSI